MKKKYYKTLSGNSIYEIEKIKGSRFIAYSYFIESEKDAKEKINSLRKEHYNATHCCYAYALGLNNENKKFSDDGEPPMTAGAPILSVIEGSEIKNILIIVVRYFGGIKLGKGGLIRAYSQGAKEVLDNSNIIKVELESEITIEFTYNEMKQIYYLINSYDAKIKKEDYLEKLKFTISINIAFEDNFKKELIEKTKGKVRIV